jgi:hypothetical protein
MKVLALFIILLNAGSLLADPAAKQEILSLIDTGNQMMALRNNAKMGRCIIMMRSGQKRLKAVAPKAKELYSATPALMIIMSSLKPCLTCNPSIADFHCNELNKYKGELK